MDTPEMIWGRALAVHKPEIDFWDPDEEKQENGFLRILSLIPTILMIGPSLLVVVVATDGGSGDSDADGTTDADDGGGTETGTPSDTASSKTSVATGWGAGFMRRRRSLTTASRAQAAG